MRSVADPTHTWPARLIGLTDAAEALGVSPSTLRRWADSGRVPCVRTAGGHRRFRVDRLVSEAAGPGPARGPSVLGVAPPSRSLPVAVEPLVHDGRVLARTASDALYAGSPGWWTTDVAVELTARWGLDVAASLRSGDYELALAATHRLMDRALRAGTTQLERHRFLERFCDVLVRRLVRAGAITAVDVQGLRRLFTSLQQSLLERVAA